MAATRRRRRKYQNTAPVAGLQANLQQLFARFGNEVLGFAVFLFGGYLGFTLFVSGLESWTLLLAGRMAWPLVFSLLITGAVLLLGRQAGYWHPEALVGAELLLLSLASLEHISSHQVAEWDIPAAGQGAGLMGWGAGNLFISLFGQLPAALSAVLLALLSIYLLFRHTPLIYLFGYIGQLRHSMAESWPDKSQPPSLEPDASPPPLEAEPEQFPLEREDVYESQSSANVDDPSPPNAFPPETSDLNEAGRPIQAELPIPAAAPARRRPKASVSGESPLKRSRKEEDLPPAAVLDDDAAQLKWDIEGMAEIIQETLQDFDIPVEIVNIESGPTITQFGVQPLYIERGGEKRKVRVSRIASAADDLALALAAPAIRIEAPVPGQPFVGIEVPNPEKTMVGLRGILQSKQMAGQGGTLPLALGRDTSGTPVVADLARAPHLLIAGATGSGKSACINGVIVSLLMYHGRKASVSSWWTPSWWSFRATTTFPT